MEIRQADDYQCIINEKKPFRRNGTTSTIACHMKKSYLAESAAAVVSAAAVESVAVESTVAVVSTAAAVESVVAAESEPPHEARAAKAMITNTFFILLFF